MNAARGFHILAFLCAVLAGAENLLGSTEEGGIPKEVRSDWLPDLQTIVYWHWEKTRHGPALTGNSSWQHFLGFLRTEFRKSGVVDFEQNSWSFRRWQTSYWPDNSQWSLEVDGENVPVASFGANSGETPDAGVTGPLVLLSSNANSKSLQGKIAVLRPEASASAVKALAETDYEYRAPTAPYPWPNHSAPDSWRQDESGNPDSVSWKIFPQLLQIPDLLERARAGEAAGAILIFDAGRDLTAGLYTFPVPALYNVPTLLLDRQAGQRVIAAATEGASATLRLKANEVESEAFQLIGYLPGRHYGTDQDEVLQLVTHTDGPSVSQDNGALGLLGLVRYFGQIPRGGRPRTLMIYLDCRHYMPGQEHAFSHQDYFARNPGAREKVLAVVGMEHLGQIEFEERQDRLVPSGRVDPSMIWATDNVALQTLAREAIIDNALPSAVLRNIWRDGVHGRSQGRWYGMASPARVAGRPAVAIMGTMGAYWSSSSGIERLDPMLFRRQVATFVQITAGLMRLDGDRLSSEIE